MLRVSILLRCTATSSPSSTLNAALTPKLQVAIVGSGPSGCYTADYLLKRCGDHIHVDIYDRMPVPFGLVRYGVAPDHPEVKNVEERFLKMLKDVKRVTWLGNVEVGKSIPTSLLRDAYHAVIIATGADNDNKLMLPHEDLANIFSARKLVNFYNTMPAPYCNSLRGPFDMTKCKKAVIIGNGNVALDIARVLGAHYKHWAPTDMNARAVTELMKSEIEEIDIIARRGEENAAFTTAEFREIATSFPFDELEVRLQDFNLEEAIKRSDGSRARKRMLELMHKYTISRLPERQAEAEAKKQKEDEVKQQEKNARLERIQEMEKANDPNASYERFFMEKEDAGSLPMRGVKTVKRKKIINFLFNVKPVGFTPSKERPNFVGGVDVEVKDAGGKTRRLVCPADVVFTSIGYRSEMVRGIPFDETRGIVPNIAGRVLTEAPSSSSVASDTPKILPNTYCVGWVKRGPKGVILHAMMDAQETAAKVLEDFGVSSAATTRPVIKQEDNADGEASAEESSTPSPFTVPIDASKKGKFTLIEYLLEKKMFPITIKGAQRILDAEKEKGTDLGKRLEKVGSVMQMLDIAMGGTHGQKTVQKFRGLGGGKPIQGEIVSAFFDDETDMRDFAKDFANQMPKTLASTSFVTGDDAQMPGGFK